MVALGAWAATPGSRPSPRVVLAGAEAHSTALDRLSEELQLLGFDVERVNASPTGNIAHLASRNEAEAVVFILERPVRIVMWTRSATSASKDSSEDFSHSVTVRANTSSPRSEDLALRAVELLRGMLLDVAPASDGGTEIPPEEDGSSQPRAVGHEPRDTRSNTSKPSAQDPSGTAQDESARRSFGVTVSPTVMWSPGGAAPLAAFQLAVNHRLRPWLRLEAAGVVPAGSSLAGAPGGALSVRAFSADARVLASWQASSRVELSAGPGVSALGIRWQRDADNPDLDAADRQWRPFFYGQLQGLFALRPMVGIRLETRLGGIPDTITLNAPHPATPSVPTVRQPAVGPLFVAASLGIELRF